MKFLLLLKGPQYLRPFVGTVQRLAERGHAVQVAWFAEGAKTREQYGEPFTAYPGVTFATVPGARSMHRREVATIRRTWNYLRYLEQPYRGAAKLRQRALDKVWRLIREDEAAAPIVGGDVLLSLTPQELKRLQAALAYFEELIPPDPACEQFLRDSCPDVMLVSPLVDLNSSTQADFVKAAHRQGIPVGLLVYSWDNLSTKGGLHTIPERVFVWNEQQRREAIELHGVPPDSVVTTGAPRFDPFLQCRQSVERETFFESIGLDPANTLVVYVCSSAFVSGDELSFIRCWLQKLRASSSELVRDCNVIVRPHPDVPLIDIEMPAVKPDWGPELAAAARRPFDDARAVVLNTTSVTPQGLFECLTHSNVVVGLNTSAEIEAGLVGRPVLSILAGEAADGQQSTLHFHYLLKQHGGFVQPASSLDEHVEQLDAALRNWKREGKEARKWAMRFIRPNGRTTPVSQVLADAIEREFSPPPPESPADVSV